MMGTVGFMTGVRLLTAAGGVAAAAAAGEAAVMRRARSAQMARKEKWQLELHGTGVPVGQAAETETADAALARCR
jgi:hypothetical protein